MDPGAAGAGRRTCGELLGEFCWDLEGGCSVGGLRERERVVK